MSEIAIINGIVLESVLWNELDHCPQLPGVFPTTFQMSDDAKM